MIERQNLFPEALSKRVVRGHVLYSPVVTVVADTEPSVPVVPTTVTV